MKEQEDVAKDLRKKLEKIGKKSERTARRIPFIGGIMDDIIAIFEAIVYAIEQLENKIKTLQNDEK